MVHRQAIDGLGPDATHVGVGRHVDRRQYEDTNSGKVVTEKGFVESEGARGDATDRDEATADEEKHVGMGRTGFPHFDVGDLVVGRLLDDRCRWLAIQFDRHLTVKVVAHLIEGGVADDGLDLEEANHRRDQN